MWSVMELSDFACSHPCGLQDLRSAGLGCSQSVCPVIVCELGCWTLSEGETIELEELRESAGRSCRWNFWGFTGGTGGPAVASFLLEEEEVSTHGEFTGGAARLEEMVEVEEGTRG